MSQILYYLKFPFVQYAVIVGILISLCAALLGVVLVLRRFSFIGDGLSHVAFGAMAVAAVTGVTNNMAVVLPITVVAAVLLLCTGQGSKIKGDASIALMSVSALAIGYLLMNLFPASSNVAGDVCSSLFGSASILTLSQDDVMLCIGLSVVVITVFIVFYNKIFAITFDESFSKTAGFTGTRCAYTVVPKELIGYTESGEKVEINPLWNRRQTTKFNGASYPVQRAAAATYTPEGQKQIAEVVDYYMENARIIRESLTDIGLEVYGGVSSPYIWVKTPNDMDSWDFFDILLNEANVVGTPGSGFGPSGEGYLRLTAFNTLENTKEAMDRISKLEF